MALQKSHRFRQTIFHFTHRVQNADAAIRNGFIVYSDFVDDSIEIIRKDIRIRFTNQQIRQIGTKGNRFEVVASICFSITPIKPF